MEEESDVSEAVTSIVEVMVKMEQESCDEDEGDSLEETTHVKDFKVEGDSRSENGDEDADGEIGPSLAATALCEPVIEVHNEEIKALVKMDPNKDGREACLDYKCYGDPQEHRYRFKVFI